MDVNRLALEHRSTDVPGWDDRPRIDRWNWSTLGRQAQRVAIDEVDLDVGGVAKPSRSLGNRVKDGLQVGGRTGYDAENLARRSLLLQSLGQARLKVADFGVLVL
jgi:hypothetical protein